MKVRDYVLRRLMILPFLVLITTIIVFALMRVGGSPIGAYIEPGMSPDEIDRVEARFGLDEPLPVQYLAWVKGVFQGELGWSAVSNAPVSDVFVDKLTATTELAALAGLIAIALGISMGTFAARRRDRWPDQVTRVLSVSGASMPTFWFGIVMLIFFWAGLGWFPIGRSDTVIWASIDHPTGFYTIDAILGGSFEAFRDAIWHMILPAIVLGYTATAIVARMMRSSLIEQLGQDYVDAARAKGLPERIVVRRHARRNALIPTITVIGLMLGILVEGSVVVEIIFQWPGMGKWLADAVLQGDQATTMAYVLFIAVLMLLLNLIVDVLYARLDRRVVLETEMATNELAGTGRARLGESAFGVRARRIGSLAWQALKKPTTMGGAIVIVLLIGMAIFAPFITDANHPDPYQMPRDWRMTDAPPGTSGHILGTTSDGGDVLYGIVWGARLSVRLSVTVVIVSVIIGVIIGSLAAVIGGKVDELLMRVVDVFMSVPELIFPLAIAAVLGPSFTNIIIALACVLWAKYARIIRAEILRVRQSSYVEAAAAIGDSRFRIYRRDILPNSITPISVQATLEMGHVVLLGATLSFIGLAEAGLAEWGVLVSEGYRGIAAGRWWAATFPGLMIFMWALAFNLVGDGLRDALDPRTED